MKKIGYIAAAALASSMFLASCDGLDQYPSTEVSSNDVYSSVDGYKQALAKIYAAFVIRGNGEGGDNADLNGSDPYYCSRALFNLQEVPTDEVAFTWINSDELVEITYLKDLAGNSKWLAGAYYSLYYIITLSNDYIRNCEGNSDEDVQTMMNEARFMRSLAYSYILDLWPVGAFVTENDPIGAYEPKIATRAEMLDYVTSELKDLVEKLPATNEQYRANKYVAAALLSRLYLNANVYKASSDTKYYDSCITYSEMVEKGGYSLNDNYKQLFNADNYKRTNEIIFSFYTGKDGNDGDKGYGSTTQIISGGANNTIIKSGDDDQDAIISAAHDAYIKDVLGCEGSVWNCFRARKNCPANFDADNDSRYLFFSDYRQIENTKPLINQDASEGYVFTKFCNTLDDGSVASEYTSTLSEVDLPILRYSEVLLNEAEAILRGGAGATSDAVTLVNMVRERAGVADFSAADLTATENGVQYWNILAERGREFYLEMLRRTDLIRFNQFGGSQATYNWEWKGGVLDGATVDAKFNFYPLPNAELSANSALYDPYYGAASSK